MKRPILFYLIAAWCFIALVFQASSLGRIAASYLAEGQTAENIRKALFASGFILIVWHLVRFVQLRAFNRWLSIVFFSFWTVTLNLNLFVNFSKFSEPFRFRLLLLFLVFSALNVASSWYLARRSFREFAVRFVEERQKKKDSEMMQKISQKKILSDIKS